MACGEVWRTEGCGDEGKESEREKTVAWEWRFLSLTCLSPKKPESAHPAPIPDDWPEGGPLPWSPLAYSPLMVFSFDSWLRVLLLSQSMCFCGDGL